MLKLKTILGRVIRDIERKATEMDPVLKALLEISRRIFDQKKNDKNKVYSVHAPEVECISKGKAHKRYEFGCKVSVASTSRGGWFVGAMALHGNPYDGHTLNDALDQVGRIANSHMMSLLTWGTEVMVMRERLMSMWTNGVEDGRPKVYGAG